MKKATSVGALERLAWRKEQMLYSVQRLNLETDEILLSLFKLRALIDELKQRQNKDKTRQRNR